MNTTAPIVVGIDGSAASATAMRWAGRLAAAAGCELIAVHSYKIPMAEVRPETHDRLFAEREELASKWLEPAVDEGTEVRLVVKDGDPRDSFLAEAENADAGLVVLGRTGQSGGPGFMHLGSVVEHAAHHSRQPIAVIPSAVLTPITRIVVGVDGSKESLTALNWCADLAKLTKASVTVVVVKKPERGWGTRTPVGQWRHDTERQLDEWLEPLDSAGVESDRILQADTHPADGLLGAASAADGDLLVIGTKGAGGITGVRIGGVAMKVLHKASLPLVLVPPTSTD